MSAIHQALQKAEHSPAEPLTDAYYNPLASNNAAPKPRDSKTLIYWVLAALFLLLVPVVLFWPLSEDEQGTETQGVASEISTPEVTPNGTNDNVLVLTQLETAEPPAVLEAPEESIENATTPASDTEATAVVSKELPTTEPNASATLNSEANTDVKPITQSEIETQPIKSAVQTTQNTTELNPTPASKPTQSITQAQPSESKAQNTDVVTASAQHWQSKVEAHIANGEIEYAEAVLKQWIGASPKDEAPRVWLARIYISNNLYRPAEALLNEISSSEALALKGVIYEKTQRFVLAAEQFSELFNREPDSGRWLIMWAVNTENSGQVSRAVGLYKAFINNFNYEDPQLVQFAQQRLQSLGGS